MPKQLYFIESIHTTSNLENPVDVVMIPTMGDEVNQPEFFSFSRQQFRIVEYGDIHEGQYVFYNDRPDDGATMFSDGTHTLYAQREIALSNYLRTTLLMLASQSGQGILEDDKTTSYDHAIVNSYHVNVGHGNCSIILIRQGDSHQIWMVDCALYEAPNLVVSWTNHEATFESCLDDIASELNMNRQSLFIDHFLLTHMHNDHYNGLKYLINKGLVNRRTIYYMNLHYQMPSKNLNEILQLMVDKSFNHIVEPLSCNSTSCIRILHPDCRIYRDHNSILISASRYRLESNPNNSSAVYAILLAGKIMIFPGDLEMEGFEKMTASANCNPVWNHIDFFVVSHHGSKNGIPYKQCKSQNKFRTPLLCFRRNLMISVLMGRDGAFRGIYSKRACYTYDILSHRGLYYSEKDSNGSCLRYLSIDWNNGQMYQCI